LSFGLSNFPLAHRIMGRVDLSYGIYLYGFPIQQVLMSRFGKMSALENFWCSLPVTALFALGSWFLIEQPALRAKNIRLFSKLKPSK
jgi:peptidoglycan/LPS O-acetylase OafA/YrhL